MHSERIAELLKPFLDPASERRPTSNDRGLSADVLCRISSYTDLLLRWNARISLTAIRDPEEIVTRHFGESLFAARHLFPFTTSRDAATSADHSMSRLRLADLGSGAGFPGIPIKLWAPELAVTLIESNHKKATFLREVCRTLELGDVKVEPARAETLLPASFDAVTLRAVERCEQILPSAARLAVGGGRIALLIGSSQIQQVHAALPSVWWESAVGIPLSHSRALLIGSTNRTS